MKTAIERSEVEVAGEPTTYYDVACECGFLSEGWPQRKLATERRDQHLAEHETGDPAPSPGDLLASTADRDAADGIALALAKRRRA
jgi:hypothetical protein